MNIDNTNKRYKVQMFWRVECALLSEMVAYEMRAGLFDWRTWYVWWRRFRNRAIWVQELSAPIHVVKRPKNLPIVEAQESHESKVTLYTVEFVKPYQRVIREFWYNPNKHGELELDFNNQK